ncbi:MAG: hypothetical protein LBR85_03870 [Oscillospiraceae bacterium]|jgi:hypothetical protein|nr:hypothetical protein [Oscillospiraceae bacterium]
MPLINIVFAIICFGCAFLLGALVGVVGVWTYRSKKPMPFWTGSDVAPEEIRDIPAYNRANVLMWAVYVTCLVLAGVLSLFGIVAGATALVAVIVPGTFILIKTHKRVFHKYKSETGKYRIEL